MLVKTGGNNYGVDSSPTGSNALIVNDDIQISPLNGPTVQRNIIRPYRGAYETSIANVQSGITFSVELAGSGTAGTASAMADLLRACATAQTITATALTGTATAGAANSITLAAGSSMVNRFYCGQIITISSGTGSGHIGLIVDYVGSTKVATVTPITTTFVPGASSAYSIAANVSHRPISSTSGVADTDCTIVCNKDGLQRKLIGCRGTFSISLTLEGYPSISYSMVGIDVTAADVLQSTYTLATPAQAIPLVYRADNVRATRFAGQSGCYQSLSLDAGNTTNYRELINCTKEITIPDGQSSGTVVYEAVLSSVFDPFALSLVDNASPGPLSTVIYGPAGNRVSLVVPAIDIVQTTISSMNGFEMYNTNYNAIPSALGNDDWYLVFG